MDLEESRMLAGAWLLETETHSAYMHDSREHINNLLVVQRTDMAGGAVLEEAGEVNEHETSGRAVGSCSKEVEVQKISISIFITNFPDSFNAKDLWRVCNQYGTVVDTFIPDKRSKANKRYGFVRFIKADNVERLVSNLCTIWVDEQTWPKRCVDYESGEWFCWFLRTCCKEGDQITLRGSGISTALVLDESALNQSDMSTALMGKVKTFDSLSNLKLVLAKEELIYDDDQEEMSFHNKRICVLTKLKESISESFKIIVQGKVFWVRAKEECGWTPDFVEEEENESEYDEMKHPQSEDPFNLYDLLNKKNNKSNGGSSSDSNLKYPPGFTPSVADEDKREDLYVSGDENEIRSKFRGDSFRKIREWTKDKRANTNNNKKILKEQLAEIDSLLDKGEGNIETLNNRVDIFNSLQDIDKLESIELAQKAKIK
ncbi:nucleotide-binding alpha-beta plait domain-containing protein [Tanacetum coccineum]|uniref:Nucleotide-binding alpha-beta plait domain-containing protein n=1 Tax=Tanacetum coccineum TaxID=301880 RepID=A0ABQ4Z8W0_9ASTR